jgi:cytidylate kinase
MARRIEHVTGPSSNPPAVIITIDGPAGTGKSTVAHLLAQRLGLEFLDTGSMYRAAAMIAIEQRIAPDDGAGLAAAVARADMHFDWRDNPPRLMIGERTAGLRIRDMDVSGIVSIVAAQREVREVLVKAQRRIAAQHPRLVTEGRDQGSVVFPDAPLRFYLTADAQVRADRRMAQLAAAGRPVDRSRVIRDIHERDLLDRTRPDGPLIRPAGAVDVNTGDGDVEYIVTRMEAIARERLPDAQFRAAAERHQDDGRAGTARTVRGSAL